MTSRKTLQSIAARTYKPLEQNISQSKVYATLLVVDYLNIILDYNRPSDHTIHSYIIPMVYHALLEL